MTKVEDLKEKIREIFYHNYSPKKSRLILRDSNRLEKMISEATAVNAHEYTDLTMEMAWANGFVCSVLLLALSAIIIFRWVNIDELEAQVDYQISFQVWRGASYLIIFNWVCAVVCYLLNKWKINYRLILL